MSKTVITLPQEVFETDVVRIRWRVRNDDGTFSVHTQDVTCPPKSTRDARLGGPDYSQERTD